MKIRRAGFTLVELLATVFILAIGLGTVFALLTMTARAARETVLESRREQFVSNVFNSVDAWAGLDSDVVWDLPVVSESGLQFQRLVPDGTEQVWPSLEGTEPVIPRIIYVLTLTTNSVDRLEADLTVRLQGENVGRDYERVFRLRGAL